MDLKFEVKEIKINSDVTDEDDDDDDDKGVLSQACKSSRCRALQDVCKNIPIETRRLVATAGG